jgi:hypothetical protein
VKAYRIAAVQPGEIVLVLGEKCEPESAPMARVSKLSEARTLQDKATRLGIGVLVAWTSKMRSAEEIRVQVPGCKIALDDFGTGYSWLADITRFPADRTRSTRRSCAIWIVRRATRRSPAPFCRWRRARESR